MAQIIPVSWLLSITVSSQVLVEKALLSKDVEIFLTFDVAGWFVTMFL
jgi:hypothetical protein